MTGYNVQLYEIGYRCHFNNRKDAEAFAERQFLKHHSLSIIQDEKELEVSKDEKTIRRRKDNTQ